MAFGGVNLGSLRQQEARKQLSPYEEQLRSFGTDYGAAADWARQQGDTADYNLAEGQRRAREQYFSGWQVDPTQDTFDAYKQRQDLMHRRGWSPNVMYAGGGLDGYGDRANALMLQNYQRMQAGARATRFAENLDNYIAGETSSLQQSLSRQIENKRNDMMAEMNRRGLLHSGTRGKEEANISAEAASKFEQGRADIFKGAQEKAQNLFMDPALKGTEYEGRMQDIQNSLQAMRDRQADSRASMFGNATGLIGSGIGSYLGGQGTKTNKTPSNPYAASTYTDNPVG